MHTVIDSAASAKEIALVYVIVIGAAALMYPFTNLVVSAVSRGLDRWTK